MCVDYRKTKLYQQRALGLRPGRRALAGSVTLGVLIAFVLVAISAQNSVPLKSYRLLNVTLPYIGHLGVHDYVDIAGVRVGQVSKYTVVNNRADIQLQLSGVGPIPVDSKVVVRAAGLLGTRYVELDPGKSTQVLPNGGTLSESNPLSTYSWGIPDALNLFDKHTRTALASLVDNFGVGFEGRGSQLNQAIGVGPGSGKDFDAAAYAILGRPGVAQSFLPQVASGFGALNSTGSEIPNSLSPMSTTLQAFVDERPPVQSFVSMAPSAEASTEGAFSSSLGVPFLSSVDSLTQALSPVLPKLPGALRDADTFLHKTQAPLRGTLPLLNEVPSATPPTLAILRALAPDLPRLTQALHSLVTPVTQLAMHGCDIQSFATGTRALVNYGTVPGGNWGPDVGFPIGVIVGPQLLNGLVNTRHPFASQSGYYPPCAFSPGVTISQSTFLNTLDQALGGL
jgi:phospholipid/cholesterol/gamma-HCH transport system substrate-binding protein